MSKAIIHKVKRDSIASEIGLESGDIILKVNDVEPKDIIDFQYQIASEEVTIEVKRIKTGELEIIEIEKEYDEQLGIIFECAVFDRIKCCQNHCIFCFVDQQPKGLRESLYIKDDDYRLSYLQGTYITTTNLSKEDKDRIKNLHLGPLYISVHTTNIKLRKEMLNNPKAGDILENLEFFKKNGIPLHCQIVLCPGFNDGIELERTLCDLLLFKRVIKSIAIVPVGITKYRKGNILKPINRKIALETIEIVDNFNKKSKRNIAMCSDEFFILTNKAIPEKKYYGKFVQLEDGVGTSRLILDDFRRREKKLPKRIKEKKIVHIILSKASNYVFEEIIYRLNLIENLCIKPIIVSSNFWGNGDKITISGLIVGQDIIDQSRKFDIDTLIIPSVMLKPMSEVFLDDLTVKDVENKLDCKIKVIENIYSVEEFINFCIE